MLFKKKPKNLIKQFLNLPHEEKLNQLEEANELLIEHKTRLNRYLIKTADVKAMLLHRDKPLEDINHSIEHNLKISEDALAYKDEVEELSSKRKNFFEECENVIKDYKVTISILESHLEAFTQIVKLEGVEANLIGKIDRMVDLLEEYPQIEE